jgi:hypothetical protein
MAEPKAPAAPEPAPPADAAPEPAPDPAKDPKDPGINANVVS